MILKQPLEGIVQVEFKKAGTKIDTKKINPYCYSFIAPGCEIILIPSRNHVMKSLPLHTPLLYSKTVLCRGIPIFHPKHRLWVTQNQCFEQKYFKTSKFFQ